MLQLPQPLPADVQNLAQLLRTLIESERAWIAHSETPHHQAYGNIDRWQAMLDQLELSAES